MFELINENGVFLLKSTVLKSKHAFSTRIGGVSNLEHTNGLNLAFGRGDDNAVVLKNLEIFANAVDFDDKSMISVPQIHSDIVKSVDFSNAGAGYYKNHEFSLHTPFCCAIIKKYENVQDRPSRRSLNRTEACFGRIEEHAAEERRGHPVPFEKSRRAEGAGA